MLRPTPTRRLVRLIAVGALVLGSLGAAAAPVAAAGALTVTPITWDIVGLDSVSSQAISGDGPDRFPVGAKVCNTGDATVSSVSATIAWDSANAYITTEGPTTISLGSLSASSCTAAYFTAVITRNAGAYDTFRKYHITATGNSGGVTGRTPVGRQLYVEHLVSQNRNSVSALAGAGGCNADFSACDPAPTALRLGNTYTYKLYGGTSAVYDQVESFISFPNGILQIVSATTTFEDSSGSDYSVPLIWPSVWGNACIWDSDPSSATYSECTTNGRVGGNNVTTYVVKAIALGTGPLKALFYDFSGSSFHYNTDYNDTGLTISVTQPSWDLTTGVVGSGTVTRSLAGTAGCGTSCATYSDGTVVTLTATPAVGWHFVGWTGGGCSGTATTCTVTMDQSRSTVATFEQDPAGLNVAKGASTAEAGPFTSAISTVTGTTVYYEVIVTNTGAQTLTGLTLSDSMFDGMPDGCDPLPASLATGETYTCVYSVEAADGTTVNTVTVDSDQTDPAEAEATVDAALPPTDLSGGRDPFAPVRILLIVGIGGLAAVAIALRFRTAR